MRYTVAILLLGFVASALAKEEEPKKAEVEKPKEEEAKKEPKKPAEKPELWGGWSGQHPLHPIPQQGGGLPNTLPAQQGSFPGQPQQSPFGNNNPWTNHGPWDHHPGNGPWAGQHPNGGLGQGTFGQGFDPTKGRGQGWGHPGHDNWSNQFPNPQQPNQARPPFAGNNPWFGQHPHGEHGNWPHSGGNWPNGFPNNNQGNPFNGGQSPPFNPNQPNPFGQQPSPFGQQPSPFGQQPSPFGQQQPSPFGSNPNVGSVDQSAPQYGIFESKTPADQPQQPTA